MDGYTKKYINHGKNKSIQLSSRDILTHIMAFRLAMLGEKENAPRARFPLRFALLCFLVALWCEYLLACSMRACRRGDSNFIKLYKVC